MPAALDERNPRVSPETVRGYRQSWPAALRVPVVPPRRAAGCLMKARSRGRGRDRRNPGHPQSPGRPLLMLYQVKSPEEVRSTRSATVAERRTVRQLLRSFDSSVCLEVRGQMVISRGITAPNPP